MVSRLNKNSATGNPIIKTDRNESSAPGNHRAYPVYRQHRTAWPRIIALIFFLPAAFLLDPCVYALDCSGTASIELINASGENTWISEFSSGSSKLVWPIDLKTIGLGIGVKAADLLEAELSLATAPWGSSSGCMEDYDYLDESMFRAKPLHEGIDLYSSSELDAKTLIMAVQTRVFPLRTRFLQAGITAGYRQEEYDYRAYNTRQKGYGPWQDQSADITGPTSFYSLNYDIFSLGLALRSTLENIVLNLEVSSLPLVYVTDEDEHLKRNRMLKSDTSGSGYQTSFSGSFKLSQNWSVFSRYTFIRISTKGHHDQYWYGDDPVTTYDDTGYRLDGVRTEIKQNSIRLGIGASRQF